MLTAYICIVALSISISIRSQAAERHSAHRQELLALLLQMRQDALHLGVSSCATRHDTRMAQCDRSRHELVAEGPVSVRQQHGRERGHAIVLHQRPHAAALASHSTGRYVSHRAQHGR